MSYYIRLLSRPNQNEILALMLQSFRYRVQKWNVYLYPDLEFWTLFIATKITPKNEHAKAILPTTKPPFGCWRKSCVRSVTVYSICIITKTFYARIACLSVLSEFCAVLQRIQTFIKLSLYGTSFRGLPVRKATEEEMGFQKSKKRRGHQLEFESE